MSGVLVGLKKCAPALSGSRVSHAETQPDEIGRDGGAGGAGGAEVTITGGLRQAGAGRKRQPALSQGHGMQFQWQPCLDLLTEV